VNTSDPSPENPPRKRLADQFNNWISASGAVIALGSLFAFMLLFALDTMGGGGSAYLGILTFLVAPFFLILGLFLVFAGWLIQRRYLHKSGHVSSFLSFSLDFGNPVERRKFMIFGAGASLFVFLTALGSYRTYHFTESTEFCGEVCHTVMEPEYTTYALSPHARVACVDCHIGEGAKWYVKSKIDGLYQVYATLRDIYPKPVPTPIESLRPAQDTCEKCHWPQVFTGNIDMMTQSYLSDEANTPFSVRLIMKVGGGDSRLGPVRGIHWHTDPANRVEYMALDEDRQDIPWVRLSRDGGESVVFLRSDFDSVEEVGEHEVRTMDCIDCHNRPAHVLQSPNAAIDRAIALGRLDASVPSLKLNAVKALVGEYETREAAHEAIRVNLGEAYADRNDQTRIIEEVLRVYDENFFPLMASDWSHYPDNIGHKDWPGCFRCHGGEHANTTTGELMSATDCNSCHTIVAQGHGDQLLELNATGHEFAHPAGDTYGLLCSDCHTGGPQ
jgi:nitrate/TMAO reductase-like tetraheme cytochrome c subunit